MQPLIQPMASLGFQQRMGNMVLKSTKFRFLRNLFHFWMTSCATLKSTRSFIHKYWKILKESKTTDTTKQTNMRTYISCSRSFAKAAFAIHKNAGSMLRSSLADVSKYGIFPLDAHHSFAFFSETCVEEVTNTFSCHRFPSGAARHPYHTTIATININFVSK